MITAVDTNILLDLLIPGAPEGDRSEQALAEATATGAVVVCEAVCAEIAGAFGDQEALQRFLLRTGTVLEPASSDALYRAGLRLRCQRGEWHGARTTYESCGRAKPAVGSRA